jgi:folate-binding protein YgfZ
MDRSPLLALFRARGVRLAERPEAPGFDAALAFGDVPAEYRAARAGCALIDASDRGRVEVTGRDAADFLHRLLANHVKALAPGGGNANLLLTPKGKVQFAFQLARHADGFALSCAPGRAAALSQALERYHFAEELRLADTSAGHAPLELRGSRAAAVLGGLLGAAPPPLAPGAHARMASRAGELELTRLSTEAWRLDSGPEHVAELWDAACAAGATAVGLVVRDSLRVEAGRALEGLDVDENVYPEEAGLTHAFALDKGCYVGQEVVAKIDTYGGLNKRLLVLGVEHSEPVARGTRLVRRDGDDAANGARELGLVTSWAYSFALDGGLVLAYVKRQHQEPGTRFDLLDPSGTSRGAAVIIPAPVPERA